MKIERILKKHYMTSLHSIELPEFDVESGKQNSAQTDIIIIHPYLLNVAFHFIISALIIAGLFQYKNDSELSRCFIKFAEKQNISTEVSMLPQNIRKFLKQNKN